MGSVAILAASACIQEPLGEGGEEVGARVITPTSWRSSRTGTMSARWCRKISATCASEKSASTPSPSSPPSTTPRDAAERTMHACRVVWKRAARAAWQARRREAPGREGRARRRARSRRPVAVPPSAASRCARRRLTLVALERREAATAAAIWLDAWSGRRASIGWDWADLHFFTTNRPKDYSRAQKLLRRGYSTAGVRSREDIADRLVRPYRETGRDEEAEALAAEAKRISRSNSGVSVRRTIDLEDAGERAVVRDTATATFEGEGFAEAVRIS